MENEIVDVILFNESGCEIARDTTTNKKSIMDIIESFILFAGDRIEIQEH